MMTFFSKRAQTPIVNGILWATAVHIAVCAVIFVYWRMTGDDSQIELFFKYQGSLFFVSCAAVELALSWSAFRLFSRGEPMRVAWLLITFASLYKLVGSIFSQVLNRESYLNPIYLIGGRQEASFYEACRSFGLIVGGPVSMAVLAAGLFVVLRVLRRLGLLSRLRKIDYVLISGVIAFTARQMYEIVQEVRATDPPYDLSKVLAWPSDPLLCLLLIEAILIRRSALQTGWGLIAKCWGAFSFGILFTSLGNIGLWATVNHYYIPWPYNSFTWYIWFFASAAFALGPAYQVEACWRACREAEPSNPASVPE